MITQASSEHSICVAIVENELDAALQGLNTEFEQELERKSIKAIEVEKGLSIVALVGSNMKNQVGTSGKMFHTLGRNGVSVKAIAQGSSERNISAVIQEKDLRKSLNTLHESFFLSERRRLNLFIIGVGNVGKSFLDQVKKQSAYLLEAQNTKITVVGLANSKQMVFDPEGIELSNWSDQLASGEALDTDQFIKKIQDLNLRNSIFIDNTASADISSLYQRMLAANVSVVTPNKIAATSPITDYMELKSISLRNNVHFLYETNVAAGLPVLSTLRDLLHSGDQIHKIEAVLSGTLNYLYNTYDGTVPFVEVIKDAKEKGLTEPDPRLDLFGEDVMRKILILARECGATLEMEHVAFRPFLPEACMQAKDIEDFYRQVEQQEAFFQGMYKDAVQSNAKLRVVATFEGNETSVQLQKVTPEHPFYHLEGKDNIVLFYSDRYREQPLVVKGAGAGAEVTASGIFADVLRVNLE